MSFQNQNYINDINLYSKEQTLPKERKKDTKSQKKFFNLKRILIISAICMAIILIVFLLIYFLVINKKEGKQEEPPTDSLEIIPIVPLKKLEAEPGYSFKTEIGQLNTIYVNQKYTETTIRNGRNVTIFLDRKTTYNIYVISEKESTEDKRHLYSKIYTCAVSIASECVSNKNENCNPRTILSLLNEPMPIGVRRRHLEENENLENIPVPLCLFNITDHNAITSIICPKSIPERKIKGIVLDLYFYRPPGVKRVEKEKNNITITIQDIGEGKLKIREINGGRCEDETGFYSFCSTDFNATKDSEGNLLLYDELCYTNIEDDEFNYYTKKKETHLIDITDRNDTSKPTIYKEKMDLLLEKINPYMKYYEQVSDQQFKEIYDISINNKLPEKKRRKLQEEKKSFITEEKIFEYKDYGGAVIALTMEDDSSIGTLSFKANSYLKYNEEPENDRMLVNNIQQSNLTGLLDNLTILSKSGNHMANELYENIKISLQEIIKEIDNKISYLNNFLIYQNITKIFDSSLNLDDLEKLPLEIKDESNILYNKIMSLLTELNSSNIKQKFKVISETISEFISKSYMLVNDISSNLNELGNSLNSEGNILTQISMYYLNKESSKYMKLVQQAQEILENYYKKEAEMIKLNISLIKENFETNFNESSEDEKNMIIELSEKLKNKTFFIQNITDDLCNKTIDYLYNTTTLINDISYKIKELISNELDLKGDYFLSESDIKINNISFTSSIGKIKEIANKLDNNLFIDKKFDEIMSDFRHTFTNILISINTDKENLFSLQEEVLNNTLFKNTEKKNIQNKFNSFSTNAINEIKNENEKYKKDINTTIMNFLYENQAELNSLILDLYVLFSNESLIELANLFDLGVKSSLKKMEDEIIYNEDLAKKYFNDMKSLVQDSDSIITLLKSFQQDKIHIPDYVGSYKFQYFIDSITEKKITNAYITKYNAFKSNFKFSKDYIDNQLYLDQMNTYKDSIIKIRKALQSIKNNKLYDKYPEYQEIGFEEHKKKIDILFNRFNTFFSDNIYNDNYNLDSYKSSKLNIINEISNYIENSNNIISNNAIVSDYSFDYCVTFFRQKYYMCSNRQWKYPYYSDNYCVPISQYSNNYINLKEISFDSEPKIKEFNNKFNLFYNTINKKIEIYNSKIDILKSKLLKIESEIMNKNPVFDYINSFKSELNEIFNNNYGVKLIQKSYNYYKDRTNISLEKILNKTTNYWIEAYETLENNLNNNKNNINTSLTEFSTITLLYNSIITQNITKYLYNSIIVNQRNEFNYTISYYYNYLLRLANSTHNYLINRILVNQNYLNFIIEERINLINNLFYELMENITLEEKNALKIENQLNILMTNEDNFFKLNNILEDNILLTTETLNQLFQEIKKIKNKIKGDQYSVAARFYLENILCGEQIEYLYKQINEEKFIKLNEEVFKQIVINNNWLFNFDEFTNELEVKLYYLKKEINDEYQNRISYYANILEEILNIFFTKDTIIEKVNELYREGIKKYDNNLKSNVLRYLNEILNIIKQHLSNEKKRLETTSVFINGNTESINNIIKNYKNEILNKFNETIVIVANDYYQNIYIKFYEDYISKCLDIFYEQLKNPTIPKEYKLLNSSFNLNNILNGIIINLQNEYKAITKKQLLYKHNLKLDEIYNVFKLDEINNIIDNAINPDLDNLKEIINEIKVNDAGYSEYTFNNQIIINISQTIEQNIKNIEKLINSTKGDNYQIEIKNWKEKKDFDFTVIEESEIDIKVDIIGDKIENNFKEFINSKYKYEKDSINELLEEIIKNNFNNLLNYLIPSFGKLFFERIIKYNENFKILGLYDNLRFSITETLSYYITLLATNSISALPKDLKINLYNLNNLYLIVENYNRIILDKLNDKVDDFIDNIQDYILSQYSRTYDEFYVEKAFNDDILSLIKTKLQQVNIFLKKDFKSKMDTYLKEPFIKTYKEVMNKKTNEMLIFANNQKESLRQNIYDKLTINSENILNEIQENFNKTENSINKYYEHNKTFKISDNLIQYLNSYYDNNIKPNLSNLKSLINEAKSNNKYIALKNLNVSSEKYENNFNLNEFLNNIENIIPFLQENYINNITESIEKYDADNYKEKLKDKKLEFNNRKLRILNGEETQEDIENLYYEKIADKALGKTFKKLLNASNLLKSYIDGGNEFDKLDDKINEFEKKFKDDYEKSFKIIADKNEQGIFDEETFNIFNGRLTELSNKTKEYYIQIYQEYNIIRSKLKESIYNIDESLIKCFNETNKVFNEEYNILKKEFIPIKINNSNNDIENNHYEFPFNNQITGDINYDIYVSSYKNSYFSFNLEFEGIEENQPIVTAKIINLSGPKDIQVEILSGANDCGDIKKILKSNFNGANYTMVIKYDTDSTDINITNILHIKDYSYSLKQYKLVMVEAESDVIDVNGVSIDIGELMDTVCEEHIEVDDQISVVEKMNTTTYLI